MFFYSFTEWTLQNVIIRVLTSLILGGIIGIDRGVKRRGGGARMNATVCLGATMVMLVEQYIRITFPGEADFSRMAAQVISGVGFLGAGTIIVSGHQIKGLTSAASVWTCACIGLAVGIGFIDGAVLVTVVLICGLHVLPYIEEKIYRYSRYMTLYIEVENGKVITSVLQKLREDGCRVDTFDVERPKAKGQNYTVLTTFRVKASVNNENYMRMIKNIIGVVSVDDML